MGCFLGFMGGRTRLVSFGLIYGSFVDTSRAETWEYQCFWLSMGRVMSHAENATDHKAISKTYVPRQHCS